MDWGSYGSLQVKLLLPLEEKSFLEESRLLCFSHRWQLQVYSNVPDHLLYLCSPVFLLHVYVIWIYLDLFGVYIYILLFADIA